MNPDTLVAVFCYQGDQHRVENLLPRQFAHGCPVAVLSPEDSPVQLPGVECLSAGLRAYIGQPSIDRHRAHLRLLLQRFPQQYFFLNDPDSFCLSPELPSRLYQDAQNTVWSNEVVEPRPHASPYPKVAMQPPYFLTRDTVQRLLDAPDVPAHPITPYLDWYWLALCYSAGAVHRDFTLLEHPSTQPNITPGTDPWQKLEYRIRHTGTVMMHPIKTTEQLERCVWAYANRDR